MHTLVLALALLAVLCLPVFLALILGADELLDRLACAVSEWRDARRERRTIKQLDRAVDAASLTRDIDLTAFDADGRPPIEEIAADLRRLAGQRLGIAGRSQVWQCAVLRAYDDRLRLASQRLGVAEHLAELEGMDLEIERVRVEGELTAAGLSLPAAPSGLRRKQRGG
ncbi:hypothetical protein SAMN05444365_11267 [Micromonospora pattaloongensis]|uniref:Uncharacterized protein n=1 Tax=Micromonospora pattaloongensis TaxID=405436 RepID=A0A1H3SKQ2_9ACTN|nr:hypothetical protein SAMN05444365_11267 [Micromonospora pattaloongensis]